jgi:hypothetical protein
VFYDATTAWFETEDVASPFAWRSPSSQPSAAWRGLTFEQTEHLVRDRLSWMRFCGLSIADAVPDANTLWDFREVLIAKDALELLFERLDQAIKDSGYLPMSGQIVDASLVAAPRQRNTVGAR